ncbi:hypothetical protein [Pseudomonas sp. NBRC 111130]|uniref:hypothetical protein n=1 Tax=Pseudomonas sp. NBRC 111130 TaxID=1661045 RepID=UPI00210D1222|nr:hypothetical protein [Pseudomonas sp. NBRC 111130]
MALYGTENISPELALKLGVAYFSFVNLPITGAAYYKYLADGDHLGDHDLVEVSLEDLAGRIAANSVSSFRLYNESNGVVPWLASYGYNTDRFSNFCHIDAQSSGDQSSLEAFIDFFKEAVQKSPKSSFYGIAYRSASVSKGFNYAAGENFVSIYPFENSGAFKKEVPGRHAGQERYKGELLRMVYEVNLLNSRHLELDVSGVKLGDWILQDYNNGVLKKISESIFVWLVQAGSLGAINERLGKLGLLLAWKASGAKALTKKIP